MYNTSICTCIYYIQYACYVHVIHVYSLYCRYSFEGDTPINLGYLHASLAHFSSNNFIVQVTCCFGFEEVAERINAIMESRKPLADQALVCTCI